jgi:TetR/AcrR family transcriptional regulator, mexCD-oprJ operon repressor
MSNLDEKPRRADARRNVERILAVTTELIATDPGVSMEKVAAAAGVSRATLYHHFRSRDALMDELTDQSIGEVTAALAAARAAEGPAPEAMERVLGAAWRVIGRYRGLVIVNQRLERAELRARLAPALAPVRALIRRGQSDGAFDPELPAEWLLNTVIDLIHGASRQVTAGAMDADAAERALLRTAGAALTAQRR